MKKFAIYSLVLVLGFASCKKDEEVTTPPTSTNIAITSNDFGTIDKTYYKKVDTSNVDSIKLEINDGILDLSMLSADESDSTKYQNPENFASHVNFPDANIAMEENEAIIYIKKSTSKIEVIGVYMQYDTIEVIIPFTDFLTIMEFPMTIGDSISDTGEGETTVQLNVSGFNIPVNVSIKMQTDYVVKSQETVKTPTGKEVCLKEYRISSNTYTMSPDLSGSGPQTDKTYTYNYYAKNKGDTYVEVNLDDNKKISKISYLE